MRLQVKCQSAFLIVCGSFLTVTSGCADEKPQVSRVLKLTHLAIILPELKGVQEGWGDRCELWSPEVNEVAVAEKALLQFIEDANKNGATFDLNAHYLIQYYGLKHEGRKLIVCQCVRIEGITKAFPFPPDELFTMLLTESFSCTDGGTIDLFYFPSKKKIYDGLPPKDD